MEGIRTAAPGREIITMVIFKQGNKILTKIQKYKNRYYIFIPTRNGNGIGAEYDLEINAIMKTHDYIKGILSIRSNKKYTMTYIYDNGHKEKYIYYAD